MSTDHKDCDTQFAQLESSVDAQKWDDALEQFGAFESHMLKHFAMEEEVMFPAFNESGAQGCNPTGVMIMEHDQMRGIMRQMAEAIENKDKEKFLGYSENLLFVMGQHNMKEEQIMYSLADNALDSEAIIEKMKAL
jgi:hemerythrin-like domain-containing protein